MTDLTLEQARAELLALILDVSFEQKKVTLASGRESNFYLDLRQTLMRPKGVALAGRLVLDMLQRGTPVEAVGGMAVGAVPLVSAVLAAAASSPGHEDLLGFFVRKETKKHGMGRQVEGGFNEGQVVALVEDTTTTRGEGASEAFAERGLVLEPLFTRADLNLPN